MPRTLLGIVVGAAIGVAGALMQALTRNPLADPGLLGVNAGASAAVVIALSLGLAGATSSVWFAFLGAALASVAVYAIGTAGRGGATPVRLALAGTAITRRADRGHLRHRADRSEAAAAVQLLVGGRRSAGAGARSWRRSCRSSRSGC